MVAFNEGVETEKKRKQENYLAEGLLISPFPASSYTT
jgi:hypothetical protein